MTKDQLLKLITDFYLESSDFNGYPVANLVAFGGLEPGELVDLLLELLEEQKIALTFGSVSANPNLKLFPDLPVGQQIEKVRSEGASDVCAYPTEGVIRSATDVDQYNGTPFTKRLVLGEPHIWPPLFFDMRVLERYFGEPRYRFLYDYGGTIQTPDEYYDDLPPCDRVYLKTFGLAKAPDGERVIAVYLTYLHDLPAPHQQHWETYRKEGEYTVEEEYIRVTMRAEFAEKHSIFKAFLEEQAAVNGMCNLMKRPPLFRSDFREERPREFSIFFRSTLRNFNSFVHVLDKMLSDNLNKDFFRGEVQLEEEIDRDDGKVQIRDRGTVALLEDWLSRNCPSENEVSAADIVGPLKEVRKLRQRPAHAIEDDAYDPELYARQNDLMLRLYRSMKGLRILLAREPKAAAYELPDWLEEGRIKIY